MLQLPKLVRMIVYVLLLTPYSLEPLGYMPMMFTGAAYYIIKVLIPIMLIDILLKIRLGIPVRRYLHILITYFAAVYLTALSCGLYLLICGLFPIILYELFTVICSGSFKNFLSKNTLLLSASLVIYGLGYASAKIYGADIFTNEMVLTTAENFVNKFCKMYCRHCRAVRRTAKSENCRNISLWYPLSVTYGGFFAVCHYSDCNDKDSPPTVRLVKKRSDRFSGTNGCRHGMLYYCRQSCRIDFNRYDLRL